jgi:hypothetical protein
MSAAIDSMQNYHCNIALTELIAVFLGIAGIGALMQQILSFRINPFRRGTLVCKSRLYMVV